MFEAVGGDVMTVPETGSAVFRAGGEWQKSEPDGFWIKPLVEDAVAGVRTWLMKVDPGASAPLHSHDEEIEQVYVVEGGFSDGEASYGPGDYIVRAPGAPHLTACEDGAITLLFYSLPAGKAA